MKRLKKAIATLLAPKPEPPLCTDENIAAIMGREQKPDDIARRGEGEEI